MMTSGMYSSATPEWATPQDLFDELNAEFKFNIDVCATPENAKCRFFYTKEQDGLIQDWNQSSTIMSARCWMNPPYGRQIGKWVKKAHDSGCLVVGLLPARTDTRWFHDYIYGKAEIRFLRGRLYFNDGMGPAPFPSMVVIWNKDTKER
jgi:site-specific DNA-methyltransferase (adenine-specific)